MSLGRVLVLLVIAVGGLAMAGYGWANYQNQQSDVQQAVTVEGTVEHSDVEHRSINSSASAGYYKVIVSYRYTYDGQAYTSGSVYPGAEKQLDTKEEARDVASQFSPGQTVTVYVNQENPSRSYLIKEKTNTMTFTLIGIGGVIAVLFLWAVGKELVRGVSGG